MFNNLFQKIIALIVLSIVTISLSSCHKTTNSEAARSSFEFVSPCPFPAAKNIDTARIKCGYLTAPENRDHFSQNTIRVPVSIIKSKSSTPHSDPVVFLHGGPGGGSLSAESVFDLFSRHAFGTDRDIILLDQRGALMSEPALRCDNTQTEEFIAYSSDLTLKEKNELLSILGVHCLKSLVAAGIDLHGYNATENAQDLLDLRLALGIEQWNLMGVSYGTYMALEAARVDASGIRSLILDSPVSFESDLFFSEASRNYARAIERVLESCGSNTSCNQAFPGLREKFNSLIENLKNKPIKIRLSTPALKKTTEFIVNWHDFLNLTHWMLYNEKMTRLVPLLINETHAGNLKLLTYLSDSVFPAPKNQRESARGAFLAIVCEDQHKTTPRPNPSDRSFDEYSGFSIVGSIGSTCATPELGYTNLESPLPLISQIPTLLLSGYFDPMTPDIYAEQIEKNLTNSIRITIPNFGHSTLSGYTACQTVLANSFLNNLQRTDKFNCLSELRPPEFVTTTESAFRLFTQ